jgi:hypothetical protein
MATMLKNRKMAKQIDTRVRVSYINSLDFLACVDVDGVARPTTANDAVPLQRQMREHNELS